MAVMRKFGVLAAPMVLVAAGAAMTGCDEDNPVTGASEDLCGDCGDITQGDIGISGNAKLDGFFAAVSQLDNAVISARGDFELGLSNLEAAWGIEVDADASLDARVSELVGRIEADIDANASGGLVVAVQPARCSANLDVAVQAQAKCEAKADCQVEVDPGSVEVTCEGTCTGSCEGTCEGEAKCQVDAGGVECEGMCEGSCEIDGSAECTGTCHGECSGECSAYDGEGNCAGSCKGDCEGTCELSASAECNGTCTGKCTLTEPQANCEGSVKCEGTCEASCSGGCEGKATPPSASADCEASAECEAQASAQASASMECTPPSIDVGFEFEAGLEAEAKAEFSAKMAALKANAGVMVQSFTKYQALIDGKVNGEVVFETSPVLQVVEQLNVVVSAGVDGELFADIPAGRIGCVLPAMNASIDVLDDIRANASDTLSAQASFVGAFSTGFGG